MGPQHIPRASWLTREDRGKSEGEEKGEGTKEGRKKRRKRGKEMKDREEGDAQAAAPTQAESRGGRGAAGGSWWPE